MKHLNEHTTEIIPGSLKRSKLGGLEFHVRCCQDHEESVHIQNAHRFAGDLEALTRVIEDHHRRIAENHESHCLVEKFIANGCADPDCGCK